MEGQMDELTDTGVIKLQHALDGVTHRIVAHFKGFMRPRGEEVITVDFCAADFCVEVLS